MPPFLFLALMALGAGCGGGSVAPPPPPPPPGPGAPALLAILAGDGQKAAPATPVSTPPAVTVRDAAGRVVPGVAVTFAVDSGGGTVTGGSAVSGSDGVARVGQWQLGPTEGRQVVSATAGALPPAKFVATALVPDVIYPPQGVQPTGGTVTLSRPGLPLHGLTIEFPSGALTAPASVTLTVRSAAELVLPAGVTGLTPILQIASPTGALKEPALIRVPFPATPGSIRVLGLRQPGSSVVTFLPTVVSDANGILAVLPDLGTVTPAAVFGQAAGAPDVANQLEVILTQVGSMFVAGDYDTGFRPGVDDWDFPRQPIAGIPGVSPRPTIDPGEAMVGTMLWYFLRQESTGGALWQRFQKATGVPESNRAGLRWVGVAAPTFTDFWTASTTATLMNTEAKAKPTEFSGLQANQVRMGLKMGEFGQPVPVLLFSGTSVDAPRMALAFRVSGRVIDLAIPDQPGTTFHAEYTDDAFTLMKPFVVATRGGGSFTVTGIGIAPYWNRLIETGVAAQWPRVVAGTIGTAEGWPAPQLRGEGRTSTGLAKMDLDAAGLILGTPLRHWWKCAGCAESGYQGVFGDDHSLAWRRVSQRADGSYGALPDPVFAEANFSQADIAPKLESTSGFALYQPGPGSGQSPNGIAWLEWVTIRYRRLPTAISPQDPKITVETDFDFTAAVQGLPPGAKYRWDVSGATPFASTKTDAPSLSRKISFPGSTKVVVMVLDPATGREIATDTSEVDYKQKLLILSPSPLEGDPNTPYPLTVTYENPTPAGASWIWDLGDGRTATTTTNTLEVRYPFHAETTSRVYDIKVTMKVGQAEEAAGRTTATIAPPKPRWRLASLTKGAEIGIVDSTNPQRFFTDVHGNLFAQALDAWRNNRPVMAGILATPSTGVLYLIQDTVSGRFVQRIGLRRMAAGSPLLVNREHEVGLAYDLTLDRTFWSLDITGDNGSGTIDGKWAVSTWIHATKGPDLVTLTGTFRVAEGGHLPGVPHHAVDYSFTAVRIP